MQEILALCRAELQDEVEIEFALDLIPDREDAVLKLLQIRPVAGYVASCDQRADTVAEGLSATWITSRKALGAGFFPDITNVVYISPDGFDKAGTVALAAEVTRINAEMHAAGQRYLLVGPGRWGSSDPWLGIPVLWNGISEAAVIVEYSIPEMRVEPSQGTHFFHNITSLGVGYLHCEEGEVDFAALDNLPSSPGSPSPLRVITLPEPLTIYIDGTTGEAVIGK